MEAPIIPAKKQTVSILLMRHGESEYNKLQKDFKIQNNLPLSAQSQEHLRFPQTPDITDAKLTDLGVEQSKNSQAHLSKYDIKWVITSPLRRAFYTAQIALENHQNQPNIKFKVNPYFTERIGASGDLGFYTKELIEKYPETDFSLVKNSPFWFLDCLSNHEKNHHIKKIKEIWDIEQEINPILDYMRSIGQERLESSDEAAARIDVAYLQLQEFIREKINSGEPYGKILVVSHKRFLEHMLKRHGKIDSNQEQEQEVSLIFNNSEIRELEIEI